MDINQLKSFVTVAHQGNLTQAAERLFLSQPAVSAQIKAIENDLGTPLFNRTSNGMTLTRAGEVFLPEAEALLQHKHKLEQFAKTLAQDFTEETQLGIIHPIDSTKLANLTALINQNAPNTRLHIQYGMSGEILSRIQNKTLHGGFFLGNINQRGICSLFLQNLSERRRSHHPRQSEKFGKLHMDRNVGRVRQQQASATILACQPSVAQTPNLV